MWGTELGSYGTVVGGSLWKRELKFMEEAVVLRSSWDVTSELAKSVREHNLPLDGFSAALLWPQVCSPGETFSDVNREGQPTQHRPALSTQAATQWHLLSRDLEIGNIPMKLSPQCPSYLALPMGFFPTNTEEGWFFFFVSTPSEFTGGRKLIFST